MNNRKAQSRLPVPAMIIIGIVVVFVAFLISKSNASLNDKDMEIFAMSFAIAGLAYVFIEMKNQKLRMEGV